MTIVLPQHDLLTQMQPMLQVSRRWLIAYAVLLARPLALLSINPIFTRVQLSNLLKGVIATGLIFPMWPVVAVLLQQQDLSTFSLMLIMIKEALVGAAIGFPLGLPFWALLAVGDIVDQQRGATQGRLNDPAGFGDMSVTGTLLLLCAIMVLVSGGHLDVIADTLYTSWSVWRPLEMLPLPSQQAAALVLHLLDRLEAVALNLAMPLILVMMLSDLAMLLIARIAPQLRIDDLSLGIRNIVFFIFMPLYAGFLLLYSARSEGRLDQTLQLLAPVLSPSATGHPVR